MVAGAGNGASTPPASGTGAGSSVAAETLAGGYLGISHTHASTVTIENPGRTSMAVRDLAWEGKPFKSPIYYGLRTIRWAQGGPRRRARRFHARQGDLPFRGYGRICGYA